MAEEAPVTTLRTGDEFVVRTRSGSVYRVVGLNPVDGLPTADVIQVSNGSPYTKLVQLHGAFLAVPYGAPAVAVGRPLEFVGVEKESGRRVTLRTSVVADLKRVF